jgi:phosphoribosylformylglycinamidine synthase
VIVGEVIAEPRLRILHHGELMADIPNQSLTDDAPLYHRPVGEWKRPGQIKVPLDPPAEVLAELNKPRDYTADLKKLLASPNICSKRWVFEQYDSMVQTNTVQGPGGEAGVMRIKDSGTPGHERGIAMALDGNGRWCYLDPKLGAALAVAEAARKVACTGATPVAATNCLNFGNPEKPEIMAQLSAAIDGISEACIALGTPITGGNVSLYNETRGEGIYPTPVIGIVGILDDVTKAVPADFQEPGDVILVLQGLQGVMMRLEEEPRHYEWLHFGSSEYAKSVLGATWGMPPLLDLAGEANLHRALAAMSEAGVLKSASDVSDGIAVTLAEAGFAKSVGAMITIDNGDRNPALSLFEEHAHVVVVSCGITDLERLRAIAEKFELPVIPLGVTAAKRLEIRLDNKIVISESVDELRNSWSGSLESMLHDEVPACAVGSIRVWKA